MSARTAAQRRMVRGHLIARTLPLPEQPRAWDERPWRQRSLGLVRMNIEAGDAYEAGSCARDLTSACLAKERPWKP